MHNKAIYKKQLTFFLCHILIQLRYAFLKEFFHDPEYFDTFEDFFDSVYHRMLLYQRFRCALCCHNFVCYRVHNGFLRWISRKTMEASICIRTIFRSCSRQTFGINNITYAFGNRFDIWHTSCWRMHNFSQRNNRFRTT